MVGAIGPAYVDLGEAEAQARRFCRSRPAYVIIRADSGRRYSAREGQRQETIRAGPQLGELRVYNGHGLY